MANPKLKRDLGMILGICIAGTALSATTAQKTAPQPPPRSSEETPARPQSSFNEVAQSAVAAVVSISVVRAPEPTKMPVMPGPPDNPDPMSRSVGLGSGVLIRRDGYVLTNHHVVEHAEKITVTLDEKHKVNAKVIGSDPKTDLAILKLETNRTDYPTLAFGDSSKSKVGDWALAIGSPFGLNRSVSKGIISAKGRAQMGILDIEDFIQTDAAINPGSSGGPLLNLDGEMIGINTAIFTQGSGFVGIGFAIPAKIAKDISEQLIAHGHVERGWLGMAAQDLDEDLARYFQSPTNEGALVSDVQPKSPASQIAVRPGDIVLEFDHQKIQSASQLKQLAGKKHDGEQVTMQVLHQGSKREVDIRIGTQPPDPAALLDKQQAGKVALTRPRNLGVVVEDIPAEMEQFLNTPHQEGAMVASVEPGSPAFESGLAPGDVILRADQSTIKSAKDFVRAAHQFNDKKMLMLYIQRGPEEKMFVPIKGA